MDTVVDHRMSITAPEQVIYDHLLYCIEQESPEQMIQRFRMLFLDGGRYPDDRVSSALGQILASSSVQAIFPHLLNRCCHILINRWQSRPQFQLSIPLLIELFEAVPDAPAGFSYRRSLSAAKLQGLVKGFRQTHQYATLRRLAQVLSQSVEDYGREPAPSIQSSNQPRSLGTLIQRYPYLYQHCLLDDRSTQDQQNTVYRIQTQAQQKLELDLSRYITYHVRRSQIQHQGTPEQVSRLIRPVANPTLLDERNLNQAIRHYSGKAIGGRTYRDVANGFILHTRQTQTYASFKDNLYQYIVTGVEPTYGQRQFNNQLHKQLQLILPDSATKPVNDFLVVRTCSQLLNFLVVDNAKSPHHFVFIDLVTNLGPILTTGLLLRIVLFCSKVRPYLERRFSILFNHYEYSERGAVQWLVTALETLNVAFVTNFGTLDLSLLPKK
ncbi:MAG: hypothetical protein VKJ64_05755 [Leptolyngbyaceae bacterium]|nr:hypothetical protein [Leptolyngbyaceae bacterium]